MSDLGESAWEDHRMANVSLPVDLAGRTFQLWDYSPSHRTLLARSPAAGTEELNIDLRFTGVRSVELETKFALDSIIQIPDERIGAMRLLRFVLIGPSGHGVVVAENVQMESNRNALFEALDDAGARTYEAATQFESDVLAALKSEIPEARIAHSPRGSGPDFALSVAGRRALVEAVWGNESDTGRQARRVVMDRASRWDRSLLEQVPLFIVVGGLQSDELAAEIVDHLTTALGRETVSAFSWRTSQSRKQFVSRLRQALIPRMDSPTSAFQVFRDSTGLFRWRLLAPNGGLLATGDAYETREQAQQAIKLLSTSVLSSPIRDFQG